MGVGSVVCGGLISTCFVVIMWKVLMGSLRAGSVVTRRGVLQFLKSLMDLRGEGSVQGSGETSVLCCFCFFFVSLALVQGCFGWPRAWRCYATDGWSVDADNFSAHGGVLCRLELQRQARRCPQCPRHVVDIMIVLKHVVAHIVLKVRE